MIRCMLGVHRFGLMQGYRLKPSVVWVDRCSRCGDKAAKTLTTQEAPTVTRWGPFFWLWAGAGE